MKTAKYWLVWIGIILVLMIGWQALQKHSMQSNQITYSELLEKIDKKEITSIVVKGSFVSGYDLTLNTEDKKKTYNLYIPNDYNLISKLIEDKVKVEFAPPDKPSIFESIIVSIVPFIILMALFFMWFRSQSGVDGKGGAFSFGKSKARLLDKDKNDITFADVAGCDEAKEEVQEIVDYLKAPSKYQTLGGRVPRGVLLVGSPGTGKTLLAKAIAGEAKVPFFNISGSDFVEMFVGVGASRVRDMFTQAKKNAPCIIFIDEIDAVGRQRGAGLGGGNDEREQTLNQLLVEMDGFDSDNTVIVVAATNRPDVLDPALQRPGRFDRQVMVPLPDIKGREQIIKVHIKKVKYDIENVDIMALARATPGFSGADLANLVNEAALFAGRRNKKLVDNSDFEEAKDKVYMGPERKSMVMTEEEKRATAYHESGHAVVAEILPETDPVHKVTIVPRGRALGVTWQLPERDNISVYKDYLLNKISILFGGRIAEELFVKRVSTGASNDFEKATSIAKDMVIKYGMSEKIGPIVYAENEDEVFLGRSVSRTQHISESTMKQIDKEIRRIIDEQYKIAKDILTKHSDKVEMMTASLMKWETIDVDQIKEIMDGKEPSEPKDYSHNFIKEEEDKKLEDNVKNNEESKEYNEKNNHHDKDKDINQDISNKNNDKNK